MDGPVVGTETRGRRAMKESWEYWRLMDRTGRVIGFSREDGPRRQFAELYGLAWSWTAIVYADRIRIEPPEGLLLLRRCR